jgi:hypothetical protein
MLQLTFLLALFVLGSALRTNETHDATEEAELSDALKSGLALHLKERIDPSFLPEGFGTRMNYKDHNGIECSICGQPKKDTLPSGKVYKEFRTDCGQSRKSLRQMMFTPLASYKKSAEETESGHPMEAFCALNMQKSCSDAVANEDYLYYAKSIEGIYESSRVRQYDWSYCALNGWLDKDLVDLAHSGDFHKMQATAQGMCETKYMKYNWNKITLAQMMRKYLPGMVRGRATYEEANFLGAWNCAMGDAACDMAYCAFTYCNLGDGQPRAYFMCPGWDPVKGMRP